MRGGIDENKEEEELINWVGEGIDKNKEKEELINVTYHVFPFSFSIENESI